MKLKDVKLMAKNLGLVESDTGISGGGLSCPVSKQYISFNKSGSAADDELLIVEHIGAHVVYLEIGGVVLVD